jgi:phosphate transport system substrate-binding protein
MIVTADSRPSRGMRGPARFVPFVFLGLFVLLPACRRSGGGDGATTLTVAGSTSVQPFAEKLAETYMAAHPECAINVQGGGSTAGVRAAETGAAQIGMSSRHLKDSEKSLHQVTIALDGIAIIVNAGNPVAGLTRAEVAAIFAGETRRWSQVGGPDRPIHFVTREEGSGTRGAFEEMVMGKKEIAPRALVQDSNGAVREIVASDPNALGYISLGLVDRRVRAIAVDGVLPTRDTIMAKRYAVVRPFLFLTREAPAGAASAFVDFVCGAEGQRLLGLEGLIPVGP